ncbi:hypothetical protein NL676_009697 [Syzygium grande]|nr:hypothetical protein NL676_009697 [Syzygium grande]
MRTRAIGERRGGNGKRERERDGAWPPPPTIEERRRGGEDPPRKLRREEGRPRSDATWAIPGHSKSDGTGRDGPTRRGKEVISPDNIGPGDLARDARAARHVGGSYWTPWGAGGGGPQGDPPGKTAQKVGHIRSLELDKIYYDRCYEPFRIGYSAPLRTGKLEVGEPRRLNPTGTLEFPRNLFVGLENFAFRRKQFRPRRSRGSRVTVPRRYETTTASGDRGNAVDLIAIETKITLVMAPILTDMSKLTGPSSIPFSSCCFRKTP